MPLITFNNSPFPPIRVKEGTILIDHIGTSGSPLCLGCRTGICGLCRCIVIPREPYLLNAPSMDEQSILNQFDPHPNLRLACQVKASTDLAIEVAVLYPIRDSATQNTRD